MKSKAASPISLIEKMSKTPWVRGNGYWVSGEHYFIDIWQEESCASVGKIGAPNTDSPHHPEITECDASAIVSAVNATYGNGIHPSSVKDMYEAIKNAIAIKDLWEPPAGKELEEEYSGEYEALQAMSFLLHNALEKAKTI